MGEALPATPEADTADLTPFEVRVLRYVSAGAEISRPDHLGWVDLILPNDKTIMVAPHVWARVKPHIMRPLT